VRRRRLPLLLLLTLCTKHLQGTEDRLQPSAGAALLHLLLLLLLWLLLLGSCCWHCRWHCRCCCPLLLVRLLLKL
jgi:hypothetical protein